MEAKNFLEGLQNKVNAIIKKYQNKLILTVIVILLISFIGIILWVLSNYGYQATVELLGVIANVVTIFGIVGIIISLYKIYERSKTPDIRVDIHFGFTYDQLDGPSEPNISIEARNFSYIPVTLSAYGYILPDGKIYSFYNNAEIYVTLPYTLLPGKNFKVFLNWEHFEKSLIKNGYIGKVKLVGFIKDELGSEYKTKPFTLNVEE